MTPSRPTVALTFALMLLASAALAVAPGDPVPPGGGRLVLDTGWALPLGDLDDGLDASPRSAGARPGFELGLEWRFALSPAWSLAPTLHALGYADATGLGDDGESSLSSSALRYGLELMRSSTRDGVQPFVAVAPCYLRNRLKGHGKDHLTLVDASCGALGLTARAGLRFSDTELSLAWQVNRFTTYGFFPENGQQSFNWDTLVLRVGWRLP